MPIDVACNWHNVLCGKNRVARIFGAQKGASQMQIDLLDRGLQNLAERIVETTSVRVRDISESLTIFFLIAICMRAHLYIERSYLSRHC
ncbi:glycerate kinase [Alkalihalobacillus clausii]|uniref:glycerate kinase n=1 Tax=Shouchella TaxID=2893057 RepID=UPI0009EA7D41|nr:glycerate kinase [Shouchella clausii]MBU3262602.1 glycerate kinase [Shouchella clausii]MBU3507083.1 glycerate kinase [Shouchella clausii]MBU3534607.1 glycerate kinase [Shouchella clausii]MBX0306531.1 glycerate kinase [Shouchella clausii]